MYTGIYGDSNYLLRMEPAHTGGNTKIDFTKRICSSVACICALRVSGKGQVAACFDTACKVTGQWQILFRTLGVSEG